MAYANNREHCIALIEAGNASKELLIKELGTTDKSLASLFAQLRLMGKCPMKNNDGYYYIATPEEYAEFKMNRVAKEKATPKTKEERLALAQKREDRASAAFTNAKVKHEAEPGNRELELRFVIAQAELELASILLGKIYEESDESQADESQADESQADDDSSDDLV